MSIPILNEHDTRQSPIGVIDIVDSRLFLRMTEPRSREELFKCFNPGLLVTNPHESGLITTAQILEFSYVHYSI